MNVRFKQTLVMQADETEQGITIAIPEKVQTAIDEYISAEEFDDLFEVVPETEGGHIPPSLPGGPGTGAQ